MSGNSDFNTKTKGHSVKQKKKKIMFVKQKANIISYKSAKTDGQDDHRMQHYEMTDTWSRLSSSSGRIPCPSTETADIQKVDKALQSVHGTSGPRVQNPLFRAASFSQFVSTCAAQTVKTDRRQNEVHGTVQTT